MSPERKTSIVKVGSVVSLIAAIAGGFFASPLPDAMARRLSGPDMDDFAVLVTSNAVAIADQHLAERIGPLEHQMANATIEMRRMADKQALMSERMGEMVGELKRIK